MERSEAAGGQAVSRLLKVEEVAERLGITPRSVWTFISSGRLKSFKLGRRCRRVSEQALADFVREASRGQ